MDTVEHLTPFTSRLHHRTPRAVSHLTPSRCFSPAEPLVCQPRGQQQHAQPQPQLGAEDALAAGAHLPADHADVPAAR